MRLKENIEPINLYTYGLYEALAENYMKPEEILENISDILELKRAVKTIKKLEEELYARGMLYNI